MPGKDEDPIEEELQEEQQEERGEDGSPSDEDFEQMIDNAICDNEKDSSNDVSFCEDLYLYS